MAELLLVSNPKRRRKKAKHSRKGRMPAGLKRYWAARRAGKTGAKKHRRRRRSSARVHRKRRRHSGGARRAATGYTIGTRKIRRRKLNPHRRHSRHRRRYRNPMNLRGITSQVMPTIKAGAWGASGALALDILWGLMATNFPSVATFLTNPYVAFAAKAAGAVTVGTLGGHIAKGKGRELAVGAMTVVTHDFLKTLLLQIAPTIFGPGGALAFGAYLSAGGAPDYMGAYLSGAAPIMGTASIPQAYLPFAGSSGNSGTADGVYAEDHMGMDPWG
jgi:hypothetical protein